MKRSLWIFFLLLSLQASAQDYKRTWNWYFGNKAGLSFATQPPQALINGSLFSDQGCASISDTNGNLLFYTNGETVWNKNHQVMDNGSGLRGSHSSTQSSLIIPQPGSDSLFYIFTAAITTNGFRAHLVNMNAQNGLGAVISKNLVLHLGSCEKITATRHQNGRDVWVLGHGFTTNIFYAYLVTDKGLVTCPVTTSIGMVMGYDYGFGIILSDAQSEMKFSQDGKKLANAVCHAVKTVTEVFDFDNATGKLSNLVHIDANSMEWTCNFPYGLEFSSNSRYIYLVGFKNIVSRLDLAYKIGDSIIAHQDTLHIPTPIAAFPAKHQGLQLGPDGKIYITLVDSQYLSCITYPDSAQCGFTLRGTELGSKRSRYNLPNFITSYFFKSRIEFSYQRDCQSDTIRFWGKDTLNRGSWSWQFKRLSDGNILTASVAAPKQRFSDTGLYEVRLAIGADTLFKIIHVRPAMNINFNLGNDTTLCDGDSLLLNAGSGYYCYQWQDFTSSATYTAKATGNYIVTITDADFCQAQDSIHLIFSKPGKPLISRVADTLFADAGHNSYQWYFDNQEINGAVQDYIRHTKGGIYTVRVKDTLGCSAFSDPYISTYTPDITEKVFKVYPNPAQNDFSVLCDIESYKISISDVTGKILHQQRASGSVRIPVSDFTNGIYLLQLESSTAMQVIKLIIQH